MTEYNQFTEDTEHLLWFLSGWFINEPRYRIGLEKKLRSIKDPVLKHIVEAIIENLKENEL